MYLVDGGTQWNVNIEAAIEQCMEIVDDEADIIVDVAICFHPQTPTEAKAGNTIENWLESFSIHRYYGGLNEVVDQ